ncbi:MAG: sulfite exporter TauE/SafE family protein [Chloroflexi bacterium HGW-Chloroflexi-5]|nr:MAG: sulfite exporter TauE/SafE family protein [Chloroflexi bacterium HGW-Chloroflexi-5]
MVNALAGGGTLITFPLLTAFGLPAVVANVTNTVALCPGYFGATFAQRELLKQQANRLWLLLPAALLGGLGGAFLLLNTGERLFKGLVPWLILLASLLLAVGEPLKTWLKKKTAHRKVDKQEKLVAILPVGLAAIYGGYFGAGLSVIVLAVLGLFYNDSLTRLNALKQAIALAANTAAAVVFLFSDQVYWGVALVMMVSALAGGAAGGKLANKINASVLRWLVVGIGLVVATLYFIK